MVVYKDSHFFPPKDYKPNKHTTWNTNHLDCIAWSIGKLENDKLFENFHDTNKINAEVFVKGVEKCKIDSRLLGQNIQNVDDYAHPNIEDLSVAEEGKNFLLICSSYLF